MKKVILIASIILVVMSSCKKEKTEVAPSNASPVITLSISDDVANTSLNLTVGSTVEFMANATDADGTIQKVIFYANDVAYDTVTVGTSTKYYAAAYKGTTSGNVKFSAKAFDNTGLNTKSNEMTVSFTVNSAPVATLSGETQYGVGAEYAFTVSASDTDGTIARIDFYEGNNYVGSSTSSPSTFYFTPSRDGVYSFKAIAFDNRGASVTSNIINGAAYLD